MGAYYCHCPASSSEVPKPQPGIFDRCLLSHEGLSLSEKMAYGTWLFREISLNEKTQLFRAGNLPVRMTFLTLRFLPLVVSDDRRNTRLNVFRSGSIRFQPDYLQSRFSQWLVHIP